MSKPMKFNFEADLEYQRDAINSIVGLFRSQESNNSPFQLGSFYRSTTLDNYGRTDLNVGIGNTLDLTNKELLGNLNDIQRDNEIIPLSGSVDRNNLRYTVEMETGTGKTYVYLRSIFELNREYGFTKFIVVVPSIAIKEGVKKTLDITKDHFKVLYDNPVYNYFVYDSSKLSDIDSFARESNISIMIINIDSFNKDFNIMYQPQDQLYGYCPIDIIRQTNPFIILDEPQSSISRGSKGEKAVMELNPLCTIGFSATPPKDSPNYVYKLNSVDAYNLNLVKQIEVDSILSHNDHNGPYMKLLEVMPNKQRSKYWAKIEIDANVKGKTRRKAFKVKNRGDLSELAKREIYEGYVVNNIVCTEGREAVEFSNGRSIKLNLAVGETDERKLKRSLIHYTIKEHLDKELRLLKKGIKVLSLFFIDKVSNYREYDHDGNPVAGIYARIFEQEYSQLISSDEYKPLLEYKNIDVDVKRVHNGYFSRDRKGFKDTKGNSRADDDTYSLIMKDKEKLLSLDEPLRFIFSHSALREGWDNPNVFQICTLNETKSPMKKRQEIGRGLRLCVNQDGNRIREKNPSVNILTIMANESYDQFADSLQKEIEKDTGIKFNKITATTFSRIEYTNRKDEIEELGESRSQIIYNDLLKKGYIKKNGEILPKLQEDIDRNSFRAASTIEDMAKDREDLCSSVIQAINDRTMPKDLVKEARKRQTVPLDETKYKNDDFEKIWNRIKYKSMYTVHFDTPNLIKSCSKRLHDKLDVGDPTFIYTKAGYKIDYRGVEAKEKALKIIASKGDYEDLPNILQHLQNETTLTRKTIIDILVKSDTLDQFRKNPQEYMEESLKIIRDELKRFLVDGIAYTKLDDCYSEDEFENDEVITYVDKLATSNKSPYKYTICDSGIEKQFQDKLEDYDNIKYYIKLPDWFVIPTPIGSYNPDWAIMVQKDNHEEVYFVVETKGSTNKSDRRTTENCKIKCGEKHFAAINKANAEVVNYDVASDFDTFINKAVSK